MTNTLTKQQRKEIILETRQSISELLPSELKKYLVDVYNNRELLFEFNYYTPSSDVIISIAENEIAQKIIDNFFELEISKAQITRNKRDFLDLRETRNYYNETLQKCMSVINDYDNSELCQVSLLEDFDPQL